MSGMPIDIVAVGKLKESYWVAACDEYLKRLSRYASLQVMEVADQSAQSQSEIAQALEAEAERIKRRVVVDSFQIILDSAGHQHTSEQIAQLLLQLQDSGRRATFVIGGSWGVAASLRQQANLLLSFGSITLAHNLARVVLLEQIYRAFRIIKGEPYHK